jgi:hypothetical protein
MASKQGRLFNRLRVILPGARISFTDFGEHFQGVSVAVVDVAVGI